MPQLYVTRWPVGGRTPAGLTFGGLARGGAMDALDATPHALPDCLATCPHVKLSVCLTGLTCAFAVCHCNGPAATGQGNGPAYEPVRPRGCRGSAGRGGVRRADGRTSEFPICIPLRSSVERSRSGQARSAQPSPPRDENGKRPRGYGGGAEATCAAIFLRITCRESERSPCAHHGLRAPR